MQVVIAHHTVPGAERWRKAMQRELPDANVVIFDGQRSEETATYAIVSTAPASLFDVQPSLKAVFATGAGVERLLSSALPPSLPVIRLEDAGMGVQMVNHCVGETLNWMRRAEEYREQQRVQVWRPLPAAEPAEWPIGVFGLGLLGRQVAQAFSMLGFGVNSYARTAHCETRIRCFAEANGPDDFPKFLQATRVLILLAPLTSATRDRFDYAALTQLRAPAYMINVARGALLVDGALLAALDEGWLAGASLDVFRQEPLPADHAFWRHPKIRITPHISALTLLGPAAQQIAAKIRRMEEGQSVSGVVDRARGY